MMREEFEKLTGLTVSYNYYTENIEPEYATGDTEKIDFCAQWAKTHKADICKALAPDISGMIREDALIRAKDAQYDQLRRVAEEQRQAKESAEVEVHNLRFELNRQNEKIEELEKELKDLRTVHEVELGVFRAAEKELTENKDALAAKDKEIMKLKAMLFDMMYKTA